ncbi:MAG: peptidoglycan bridge formation glycyltransferase FemA/FemB family protein [Candidatus Uhrbacteria bacterium]
MNLLEITDKQIWNEFVQQHAPRSGAFLHSWEWAEFQGGKRIGMYQKDKMEAVAHLIETKLPAGKKYLYCPRGPLSSALWYVGDLVNLIAKQYAADQGAMFVRFDPPVEGSTKMTGKGIVSSAIIQPKQTLLLDLSKGADQLLVEMHQKTRYNIRLAEKKGVTVEELDSDQFDQVWPVFEQTAQRDKFQMHDREYYQKMLFCGADTREGVKFRLVIARYKNQIIAVTIMIDFAGVRTYLHGASSNQHREVMAPYAIHWHEIQDAIKQGHRYYDFWGVSDTNLEWKGITRFKRGFAGFEIQYPGTYDLALNSGQYWIYKILRRIRYGSRS